MIKKWESRRLYEHPEKHNKGTYGIIILHDSGVYGFMVGNVHMSCPQDWAAKIHAEETVSLFPDTFPSLRGEPEEIKYLLSADEETWRKFKSICALKGIKIKNAFLEMIQKYINEGVK